MPTRSEGLEKADKIIAESERVMEEVDRANDHADHEAGCIYDNMMRTRTELDGHAWARGFDRTKPDDGIDPPHVWPSKFGQEGRLHRCKTCSKALPYKEFECSRTMCNRCFEKRSPTVVRSRRSRHAFGLSCVGGEAARPAP